MKTMQLLVFIFLTATLPQTFFATENPSLDENLLQEEIVVNTRIAEIKIKDAQKIMNDTRQKVLQGTIASSQAIQTIKEQNAEINKIENALKEKIQQAVKDVKNAEEGPLSSFVSGAKDLGSRMLAPFKAGYGYTPDQKKTAQNIIDGLIEQQKQLTEDYEQAKKAIPSPKVVRPGSEYDVLIKRYEKIVAEINDDIHQQQLITGAAMSTQRKLFWAAVATGAAVAGMYFLAPGTTITPAVVKEIENSALSEKQSVPVESGNMATGTVSKLSPVDTTPVDTKATIADKINVEHSPLSEQQAESTAKQTELLTEETEITTPDQIAQLLKESDEDRVQQAEQEAREEELLNKRIQWQDELWWHEDSAKRAFEKFAQEHTPPAHIQKVIEDNKESVLIEPTIALKGEDGSYVAVAKGGNIERILNTDAARQLIEDNDLSSLEVPQKWIYPVDGHQRIFAEYIKGEPISEKNPLSLKETQDIVTFVEKTGFRDFDIEGRGNVMRDSRNGKLVFIDLEDKSFNAGRKASIGTLIGPRYLAELPMDSEAREWFSDYAANLKKSKKSEEMAGYLPQSGKWQKQRDEYYAQRDPNEKVERYLPTSDLERIRTKVLEENRERTTDPEESKRLADISDKIRKAAEEARQRVIEEKIAEATSARREEELAESKIAADLTQNILKAQQTLDEYKQKMREGVDPKELARLEAAVQDAQDAEKNYKKEKLEKLLKKYLG